MDLKYKKLYRFNLKINLKNNKFILKNKSKTKKISNLNKSYDNKFNIKNFKIFDSYFKFSKKKKQKKDKKEKLLNYSIPFILENGIYSNNTNYYYNLNIKKYKIRIFYKNVKKETMIINNLNLKKNDFIEKKDLFFNNNDIFPDKNTKIVLFEIKGLFFDFYKDKFRLRNNIMSIFNENYLNVYFGIYSEFSNIKINYFLKKIDKERKIFKIILDRNYCIIEDSKYIKTLDFIEMYTINKYNIILFDRNYRVDNSFVNLIIFPKIDYCDYNSDNVHEIIINLLNRIQYLNPLKTKLYIDKYFKIF